MSGEPVQSAWNVMLFLADERNETTATAIALAVKAMTTKKNIDCNDDNNDGTAMLAATLTTLPVATSAFATTTITRSIALATTWMILMMMTSVRDDCTCDNTTVTVNTTVTM